MVLFKLFSECLTRKTGCTDTHNRNEQFLIFVISSLRTPSAEFKAECTGNALPFVLDRPFLHDQHLSTADVVGKAAKSIFETRWKLRLFLFMWRFCSACALARA